MLQYYTHIVFAILFLSSCTLDCIEKKTGLHKTSSSIEFAKENDVFKYELQADKVSLSLDSGRTFTIKNAWVENSWLYECIDNDPVVVKEPYFNMVIDAGNTRSYQSYDYMLLKTDSCRPSHSGCYLGSQLSFAYCEQDTFMLVLIKGEDWKNNPEIFDTIRFYRPGLTFKKEN